MLLQDLKTEVELIFHISENSNNYETSMLTLSFVVIFILVRCSLQGWDGSVFLNLFAK